MSFFLSLISIVRTTAIKHFHDVAEMSYKTKTGEVAGEMDEFLLCLSLVAVVRTAAIKQNSSFSTVTFSLFVFVLS